MPTPHGHHGLAFGTREVTVLRRALALAVKAAPDPDTDTSEPPRPPTALDFWLLDQAIAEAESERHRLRAFELAELAHHRTALPGTATTYLATLERVVASYDYVPTAEDLAALRTLAELPCGATEQARRRALLRRSGLLAEHAMERRLTERARARHLTEAPSDAP
ncbi:hypothetical protein LO772_19770 [Yinghuangia sp. ASG 101]|uniref:hypothetical protein n=1 Tax=Yinghuangia sp. ASG 101 TaxID=2896848 RepID=UPI001E44FB7A|nr:hypothetical protein [Yinghuangia sp. ASG 101]UGQ09191.1 hypothetical protein LO772_19770 [Yinghuangia sp. ASG 101]